MPKVKRAIGLMSGTSMDGIDVALLETDGRNFVKAGACAEYPYDEEIRRTITHALQEAKFLTSSNERTLALSKLEHEITQLHADSVSQFLAENSIDAGSIDLLAFHGQTLVHRPQEGLSVQIGDGRLLAETCGIDTVYDLRQNDLANGGQGAPLVPVYHQALGENLADDSRIELPVAFVNIGGISNVTYVERGTDPIAFDCGPGNALIDQWMAIHELSAMDHGGETALRGQIDEAILSEYLAHSYFSNVPPKSLDRADFPPLEKGVLSIENGAATLAAFTARAIFASAQHFPKSPLRWIICGGGVHNRAIIAEMEKLSGEQGAVMAAQNVGLDADFMEAQAWAYLAVRSVAGLPITFPTTTGVNAPVSGGVFATAGPK